MHTNYIETIKTLTQPTKAKLISRTAVKLNKKDVATKTIPNPFDDVVKITTMVVTLAPEYEKAVNEQLAKEGQEGDFEAQGRKWGQNLGNGIVENNGKMYVSFIAESTTLVTYMIGDKIIDKSEIAPFMPVKKPSTNQGTEKEIAFRSIAVENIMELEIL